MSKYKFLCKVLLWIIFIVQSNFSYAETSLLEVENYITKLMNETFDTLNNQMLTTEQKIANSRQLLSENLDLPYMAKLTLGRKIFELSDDQLNKFIILYSDYLVKSYSSVVKKYYGQKVNVKQVSRLEKNAFVVKTEIIQNNNNYSKITIDYLVHTIGNKTEVFKIFDVITEGISLIRSQQSEFTSIIDTQGFFNLLSKLREKI